MEKVMEKVNGEWFRFRDLWSNGPEGWEWLTYTVLGILLVRLVTYLIQVLKING